MTTKTSKALIRIKLRLLWENGKRCAICGKRIKDFDDLTIDHIVPVAKGGQNVLENCQLAHKDCNCEKQDILPDMYDQLRKYKRKHAFRLKFYRIFQIW